MRVVLAMVVVVLLGVGVGFLVGRGSVSTPKRIVVVNKLDDTDSFNDGFLTGEQNCN